MASTIQVDKITDIGGNTMLESNGSGTITGLPASAVSSGTIATARLGSGTASSSTFLRGDQTYAVAGEANTPAFSVQLGFNQSQSVSDATNTKVELDSEYFDTDSAFDTSTYRFTVPSGKAGKYFFTWCIFLYQDDVSNLSAGQAMLYLNGSKYVNSMTVYQNNYIKYLTKASSAFLDLSVGDYVELYGNVDSVSGGSPQFYGGDRATFLTGFRVTT